MIKRALIAGLSSTGVQVADLRTLPAPVGKHLLKTQGYDAAFHVGAHSADPEAVQIRLFEHPGISLSESLQKEIDKHFARQELRRVTYKEVGTISYPSRARESYADDLLNHINAEAIERRGFRIVVDYGYSAGSFVLPLVLGPLGVEAVTAHAFESDSAGGPVRLQETIGQAKRLVTAVNADLGAVFDRSAERLYLIDDRAREVPVDQALLLYLRLLAGEEWRSGRVAVPITATSQVEAIAGDRFEVVRTPASLGALTNAAAQDGVVFAGAVGGGYVFPDFLPAYDAIASLCKLLELLAPVERPLSELVADLPQPTLVHRQLQCPWALKGTVMRILNERYADANVDLRDGIKIFDERGWVQVLPDPDEPLIHIYAEGPTGEVSAELEAELHDLVTDTINREEIGVRS
jgi:mannose-1-phosphate guanylyltransferase/phosphomannomutase